jgi:hypothetical protein
LLWAARDAADGFIATTHFYTTFISTLPVPPRVFTRTAPSFRPSGNPMGPQMLDIAMIVLGVGGILLMAAYAALCERI